METYLEFNGWHFNKKMQDWACQRMYKNNNGKKEYIQPITKSELEDLINKSNIKLNFNYDALYVANMCKADYLESSVALDKLIQFVKDTLDDPDAYEGMVFTRFYADCIGSGESIPWEDLV